jgi:CheY-like chemotaxis protein
LLLPLERHGYIEECYFTFSYSAIRDEFGGVCGIFTPVAPVSQNWSLPTVFQTGNTAFVERLERIFGPLPGGVWHVPPSQAVVHPITLPGHTVPVAQESVLGRLVVADDNGDMRGYISRVLGATYEVEAAPNARLALEAIRRCRPDVVISDIMMPDMNGMGLLAALRSDPETKTIPIIFLSARAGDEARIGTQVALSRAHAEKQAALSAAEVKYALRSFLREEPDPARAMGRLNDVLCTARRLDASPHDGFICLALAVVDPANGEVTFAVAGAESPLIVRASGIAEEVKLHGTPLAILNGIDYDTLTARLDPGDMLVMVSDGITEARNGKRFFDYDGLTAAAISAQGFDRLSDVTQSIVASAREFGNGAFRDDVCIMVARRRQG